MSSTFYFYFQGKQNQRFSFYQSVHESKKIKSALFVQRHIIKKAQGKFTQRAGPLTANVPTKSGHWGDSGDGNLPC